MIDGRADLGARTYRKAMRWLGYLVAAMISGGLAAGGGEREPPSSGPPAELVVQTGHGGDVGGARLSADGRFVITDGSDRTARIWDTRTGQELRALGHTESVWNACLSPDGKIALTATNDAVHAWNTATGEELFQLQTNDHNMYDMSFTPDGRRVITQAFRGVARAWDARTGKLLSTFDNSPLESSVAYAWISPDSRRIVTKALSPAFKLWDLETGKALATLGEGEGDRGNGRISRGREPGAFTPNGEAFLTVEGPGKDGVAVLWSIPTGKELKRVGAAVRSAALSSDARLIATTTDDGPATVWSMGDGVAIGSVGAASDNIREAAFVPGRNLLATVGADDVSLWEVPSGRRLWRLAEDEFKMVRDLEFTADGELLLVSASIPAVVDVRDGHIRHKLTGRLAPVLTAELSGDGSALALIERNQIVLWDLVRGVEASRIRDDDFGFAFINANGTTLLVRHREAGTADAVDISSGRVLRTYRANSGRILSATFSPDGRIVVTREGADRDNPIQRIRFWDAASGEELTRFRPEGGELRDVDFSADGSVLLARGEDGTLVTFRLPEGKVVRSWSGVDRVADVSRDGRFILGSVGGEEGLWDVVEQRRLQSVSLSMASMSPDGTLLLSAEERQMEAQLQDVTTGRRLGTITFGNPDHDYMSGVASVFATFSPDSRRLVTGGTGSTMGYVGQMEAFLWDLSSSPPPMREVRGHRGALRTADFSRDSRTLITTSRDSTAKLWDASTGRELVQLVSFDDGSWVAVSPDGRFDTNSLEHIGGLHWMMADAPMRALPIEIFMRQYYEPGLVARLMRYEALPVLPPLQGLNRVQPEVKIVSVEPSGTDGNTVRIVVEVADVSEAFVRSERQEWERSGVRDVRLFRDGRLVAYADGEVALNEGRASLLFDVRLATEARSFEFSAYAFNEDFVKSATASITYTPAVDPSPLSGTAYVISMGVDDYHDPGLDLTFAVSDARLLNEALTQRLARTGRYRDVVGMTLISDGKGEDTATKAHIRAVFDVLSGRPASERSLRAVPNAERVREATPDDLVLLSWAGHGLTDAQGVFYLLPSDIGVVAGRLTRDALSRAISSDELSQWIRDVDSGDIALVIDACRSAASIETPGFKPGPFGSRGLGQLAYDKGMWLLAASQKEADAAESGQLGQGLLSYALVREGLVERRAAEGSAITLEGLLRYAARRVPGLDAEVRAEKPRGLSIAPPEDDPQRPVLFHFRESRSAVVLDSW